MYRIYIGSNNITKQLELEKITKIIGEYAEGFTILLGVGYWEGNKEDSAIVEISGMSAPILSIMIDRLKKGLEQEAIGVSEVSDISFI